MNNIILIGFKRSGKTDFGKKLAAKLQRPFIDTDDLISHNCRQFYKDIGEESFRLLEKKTIFALTPIQKSVIATGGGTILDPDNISMLKKMGTLIYIHVPKKELKKRLFKKPLPAFLDGEDLEGSFEKMYEARLPLFEKIADKTVSSQKQLWEAIRSEQCFASPHGESLTAKR